MGKQIKQIKKTLALKFINQKQLEDGGCEAFLASHNKKQLEDGDLFKGTSRWRWESPTEPPDWWDATKPDGGGLNYPFIGNCITAFSNCVVDDELKNLYDSFGNPGEEIHRMYTCIQDYARKKLGKHTLKFVKKTLYSLVLFYTNQTVLGRVVCILDYIEEVSQTSLAEFISLTYRFLMQHSRSESFQKSGFVGTSSVDDNLRRLCAFLDKTADSFDGVDQSSLMLSISKIMACAVAHGIVGDEISLNMLWAGAIKTDDIRKWHRKEGIPSLISELVRSVASIIHSFTVDSNDTGEIKIANEHDFCRCVRWLIENEYKRFPVGSEPVPGMVCDSIWRANLCEAWNKQDKINPYSPTSRMLIMSLKNRIIDMKLKAQCSDYGKRPLPFNIGLKSPPGVGKSTWIVESFSRAALKGLGVTTDLTEISQQIATVTFSDKYMSHYRPEKHTVVFIDEMGSANAKVCGDNPVMTEITHLLGETEYYPTKADIAEKGKISFRPFVNICATNTWSFGVNDYINNPDAFRRRFSVVFDIRIKDEYRKRGPDGKAVDGIDHSKVPEGCIDTVEFKLYYGTEHNFAAYVNGDDSGWMSYTEARDVVYSFAKEHHKKTSAITNTRVLARNKEDTACKHGLIHCSICGNASTEVERVLMTSKIKFEGTSWSVSRCDSEDRLSLGLSLLYYAFDYLYYIFVFVSSCLFVALAYFCANKFQWVDRMNRKFTATYETLRSDIRFVRTTIERLDQVLDRFTVERRKFIYYAAGSILAVLTAFAAAKFMFSNNKPFSGTGGTYDSSTDPEENGKFEGGIFGSPPPPDSEYAGNPWDKNRGFVHLGKGSSMPRDSATNRVTRNIIEVFIVEGSTLRRHKTHLLGIKQQYAIGVWHTLKLMQNPNNYLEVIFHRTNPESWNLINHFRMKGSENLVSNLGNDVGMIKLVDISAFKDVTNLIAEKLNFLGELQKVKGFNIHYSVEAPHELVENSFEGQYQSIPVSYDGDETFFERKVLVGKAQLAPFDGQCGSPLFINVGSQLILGAIDCAANFEKGYTAFAPINMGLIRKGIADIRSKDKIYTPTSSISFSDNPDFENIDIDQPSRANHCYYLKPDEIGTIHFRGSFDKSVLRKPKTQVIDFPFKEILFLRFPIEYHHTLVAPKFNQVIVDGVYKSPERNALLDLSRQVTGIDYSHIVLAVEHYTERLKKVQDFSKDRVVDMYTAINGSNQSPYINSIPRSTSAGWPEKGKKYEHLIECPTDTAPDGLSPTPYLFERIVKSLQLASEGKRSGVVYKTCLKDEPRDLSKVEDRKIRLFTLGPMTSMITTKMYYGMFMGIFTANALNVETVGGLNCFSPDWGTVYKNLSKHPHIINGDFKKFDKKTSTFMMMCAFTCIIDTKIHYDSSLSNENMLNILVTLASEVANPLIMLDKDLLELPGSLSSGVLLTFLINNIVNSLYIRLAWISCYVKHNNSSPEEAILCFDDHVVFYAMGDDNVYSVSDYAVEFFNFATIQAFFKSIGLDYTNSDKTDKVYKSLPLSSATICKRKWIFDEEYDVWKCPLEKTSIMKMLTIGIKSSALTLDEQQEQCVISALIEFAQWGRQEYYARVEDLRDLVRQDFIFDDYEVIMERQKNYGLTPWVPWEPEEIKERFFSC